MSFRLDGKVALVTGAGGQLGTAFAKALADAGATVIATGRDESKLEGHERAIAADLSIEADIERLLDEVGELDILVNNAGSASRERFGEVTKADMDAVLSLNVTSVLLCSQRAAPIMRRRGGGKIVNVGSIYGNVGGDRRLYEEAPDMVQVSPVYAASKSALVNLTRDLAVQLAPWNIQVNLLSPGGVEAEQQRSFKQRYAARTPAGRMGRPEDMAGTAVYLASSASDYVTGQQIVVDGGFTAW
jgi:2-dehydro-3-deoxy-D-gluconate 5-dehydrogenase